MSPPRNNGHEDATALLAYHRFDSPAIAPALLRAGACVGLGGPTILAGSLSLFFHVPPWGRGLALVVGGTAVALGLFQGFVTVPRLLSVDSGLSVLKDGLLIERKSEKRFFPWSDVVRVVCDNDRVVLQLRDGESYVVTEAFARAAPPEIAKSIERTRMRIALAML